MGRAGGSLGQRDGYEFHCCVAPGKYPGGSLVCAAAAGATLREPMARMGHSSTRAAFVYLHDSDERQRKLAEALGDAALAELQRGGSSGESGTDLARDDHSAG